MPPLLIAPGEKPVHLVLSKDQTRTLKRGHPWVYRDSLESLPSARAGALALLKDRAGDILAKGYYDPASPLAFRACALRERLDPPLLQARLHAALHLRQQLRLGVPKGGANPDGDVAGAAWGEAWGATTGYRLLNGEGDGLPGLVCDVYNDTVVIKLDGAGPEGFYDPAGVAEWVRQHVPGVAACYQRFKTRAGADGSSKGRPLLGDAAPGAPVEFREQGLRFRADVVAGQKTGFFLDQRHSRRLLAALTRGARVLNLFSYTGGFSVYAGAGGATHVTSVDISAPAIADAVTNWELNEFKSGRHEGVAADVFAFLEAARSSRERWDVVVVDPPSFAPSKQALEKALGSYRSVFAAAAQVTAPGGVLALSSCSSHLGTEAFLEVCQEALGRAKRRGAVLGVHGQPADHPFPMACHELRYLKFALFQLD